MSRTPNVGESETAADITNMDCSSVTMNRGRSQRKTLTIAIKEDDPEDKKNDSVDAFYIAMADMIVTLSGFTNMRLKNDLQDKIQIMSGEISGPFTLNTTHVLAAHANTPKVKIARERDVPILTVEWVESLYKACSERMNPYIHASQPEFSETKCPLFYKLRFVFSRKFDSDSKRFYEKLVAEHGGKVCRYLKSTPSDANFFICTEPEDSPWYKFAQANAIPCVSLAWISDSIGRRKLSNISEYEVRGELVGFGETFACANDVHRERKDITKMLNEELDPDGYLGLDAIDNEVFEPPSFSEIPTTPTPTQNNVMDCKKNYRTSTSDEESVVSDDGSEQLNGTIVEIEMETCDIFSDLAPA